jgi:hypothetical protein
MTEIAVVLVVVRWLLLHAAEIQGPRSLVYARLAIVWVPIIAAGLVLERYLAKDTKNRLAIVCAALGGIAGWIIASRYELGHTLYEWRHPGTGVTEEMTRAYGQRIGLFAGMFAGALIGGIAAAVKAARKTTMDRNEVEAGERDSQAVASQPDETLPEHD